MVVKSSPTDEHKSQIIAYARPVTKNLLLWKTQIRESQDVHDQELSRGFVKDRSNYEALHCTQVLWPDNAALLANASPEN